MVKMDQEDANIRSLPLSFLPRATKDKLSNLLNSTKVLPADGPEKLPRDWRGLADLANITSQEQASIRNCQDQAARVLDLWMQDPTVVVGQLLDNLELMDRFDVYDDIREDLIEYVNKKDQKIVNIQNEAPLITLDDELLSEVLTYDDRPGYNHTYHAYVLHAEADQDFVDELTDYLESLGFQICTKDKLLAGGQPTYPQVAKLISERCLRIILVYSPEFLNSGAETFFRDYAQAISIDSRKNKIIPIMFRDCHLPSHLAVYHNLRYDSGMYNFWEKLAHTVNITRMPRVLLGSSPVLPRIEVSQAHSAVDIVDLSTSSRYLAVDVDGLTQRSVSMDTVGEPSSPDGSFVSDTSEAKTKKPSKKTNLKGLGFIQKFNSNSVSMEAVGQTSSPDGSIVSVTVTSEAKTKKPSKKITLKGLGFIKKLKSKSVSMEAVGQTSSPEGSICSDTSGAKTNKSSKTITMKSLGFIKKITPKKHKKRVAEEAVNGS